MLYVPWQYFISGSVAANTGEYGILEIVPQRSPLAITFVEEYSAHADFLFGVTASTRITAASASLTPTVVGSGGGLSADVTATIGRTTSAWAAGQIRINANASSHFPTINPPLVIPVGTIFFIQNDTANYAPTLSVICHPYGLGLIKRQG